MTRGDLGVGAVSICVLLVVGGVAGGGVGIGPGAATASDGNEPPVADAGLDRQVVVNETVYLDAAESYDPDGTIDGYEWRVETPDGAYTTPSCGSCEEAEFAPRQPGRYNVTVTVTDDDGAERSDTLWVDVEGSAGPSASLAGPVSVRQRSTHNYTLSATAGDADLRKVRWEGNGSYRSGSAADGERESVTLAQTFDDPGTYTLRATVVDRAGRTDSVTLPVDVQAFNRPPTAEAPGDRTVDRGNRFTVTGDATDPDDDPGNLTYSWSSPDDSVQIYDENSRRTTIQAPWPEHHQYPYETEVVLTVSDGEETDTDRFTLTVPRPVQTTAHVFGPDTVYRDEYEQVWARGTGIGRLSYTWDETSSNDIDLLEGRRSASFRAPDVSEPTTVEVEVTVWAADDDWARDTHEVDVLPYGPPEVDPPDPCEVDPDSCDNEDGQGWHPPLYQDLGVGDNSYYDDGWCTILSVGDPQTPCHDDYKTKTVDGETYVMLIDQDGDRKIHLQGVRDGTQELLLGTMPSSARYATIFLSKDEFRSLKSQAFSAEYSNGNYEPVTQTEENEDIPEEDPGIK